ncbi:YSIRK-type signal peptide-containing protein [Streptococcus salivarius]|uniref:mucin-binding protein n=1 Tax=Streptococcus salivarius TaxID=1304 RepID=UPI0012BCEFF1|nr:YSIRK-type signal peptide-containing protein [Streptococcus salivarius]MCA6655914.1 YSIRK-type signal peptide-containing protein [Streptococcus salivarius]MCA6659004.1 YSIRK-type signal peptide-containing protein [Streptococcus salivarius]MTR24534.1 YSIRK-type signal peptide-containing protein [Streptococcus salivarius]MTR43709.1 YSIRK-type signal peptide-containing protein [Streptococcus salivarius]
MRDMFNKRQRFSLRKYSFGVASVLLGVSIFSNAQGAQADETVAPTTAGMETTAEPDVVVEQSTPTTSVAPATTENAPSSVSTVALASEQPQSAAQDSQAASTTSQTAASSEVASQAASQASSESATATASSVATSAQALSSTAVAETPVAGQVSAQTSAAASVATAAETASAESTTNAVNSVLKVATSELAVTSSELNAAEASLNSENLINAMGLAVSNRSLRTADAVAVLTNAGAGSTNPDLTNLGYKLAFLPERQQYFVNIDYINHLKVGRDNRGVMRPYDYITNGNYMVVVNYANLGIIDYVDEAGNKIPGSSTYRINNSTETITANGKTYNKIYDAGVTELPPVPAGYRIKYASADKSKANAYVDVLKSERQYDYNNGIATIRSERTWDRNQSRVVDLVQFANGSQGLDASIDANGGGQYLAPGYRYHIIVEKDTKDVTKATSQTVTYTGADTKTPAANTQNDFSFNGKEDSTTNTTTWTETTHTYGTVKTPVVIGYYADKAVAGGKTVTPDAPNATDTVTYKAFGKFIAVDENGNPIPGVSTTAYTNDPNDATKMIAIDKTLPSIPGYTVKVIPASPSNPGEDTRVVYVAIVNDVTKATKQTVTFQGAGDKTPAADVKSDYTFAGKDNQATGKVTWNETSHTYGTVKVPVVNGYFADKAVAGGKTVTPDAPEATDTVTYKAFGKFVIVDENGNPIAGVSDTAYINDPNDPTKMIAVDKNLPTIPGYTAKVVPATPGDLSSDTKVVYVKNDQKASVVYRDETSGSTLETVALAGKSGEAVNYSTAERIKHYQDLGYVLVTDGYPAGATFDLDSTVDQAWTVSFKRVALDFNPDNAHEPGTPIYPNQPNGPKWPAKDAYLKDVTYTVHYASKDSNAKLPADSVQKAQWKRSLTLDSVTGDILTAGEWKADKTKFDLVITPLVSGYFADKGRVASQDVTMDSKVETVTYTKFGKIIAVDEKGNPIPGVEAVSYTNDPNDPTKAAMTLVPEVKGYKTDKTGVTPSNPGEDTKVVYKVVNAEPAKPAVNKEVGTIVVIYRDEYGNQIKMPLVITNSVGAEVDVHGDRYIYRNGVKYELIRQEGKSTDKMTEGQTVVTYIYRKVEDGSTPSNGNGGQSGSSTSKAVKATSNGSKGSKGSGSGSAADGASDGKGSDKKKSGNKDGKKADGSDKAKEGDEQLPVTGEADNNLAAMGVVVMGLMSGLAAMNRRKNQD